MTWDLKSAFPINATLVANAFIDHHMAGASGEYVKIYLYLLRHQDEQPGLAAVAEDLHYTEGDVRRAIAYWEKVGVLIRRQAEKSTEGDTVSKKEGLSGTIEGVDAGLADSAVRTGMAEEAGAAGNDDTGTEGMLGGKSIETGRIAATAGMSASGAEAAARAGGGTRGETAAPLRDPAGTEAVQSRERPVPVHSQEQVSRLADDEDFAQLLYIAQKYMNKVFTQRECQVFAYLYGELKLTSELLEYLVEYCVQNGHTSIRYMETVALNWHQRGLVTVEEAKAYCAGFSKDGFAVMKAFGLNDRRPAEAERRFIEDWFGVYGFTREIVLEACDRTIRKIHSPSFEYADKILQGWKEAGVKRLSDVEELDMIYQKQEKEKTAKKGDPGPGGKGKRDGSEKGKRSGASNRFHNFEQSATDYDSLMMEKVRARMQK